MGLVADLGSGKVAIRGEASSTSLELNLIHIVGDGEAHRAILVVKGHAGAKDATLTRAGVEAAIGELQAMREEMARCTA